MKRVDLGPEHSDADASAALKASGLPFVELRGADELCDRVSGLLAEGKVVGWHQGRSEWGPRSLGQRSILADPRPAAMKRYGQRKDQVSRVISPVCAVDLRRRRGRVVRSSGLARAGPVSLHARDGEDAPGPARSSRRRHARGWKLARADDRS